MWNGDFKITMQLESVLGFAAEKGTISSVCEFTKTM